jgi:hypothetical protein
MIFVLEKKGVQTEQKDFLVVVFHQVLIGLFYFVQFCIDTGIGFYDGFF